MVVIDGSALTVADVVALAGGGQPVLLTAAARERITRAARFADEVAARRPVYGRTTAVGANRTVTVRDPHAHAMALLRSHASAAGLLRSRERVRAMLAIRVNQLAAGGSGVSAELVDALVAMLAADALPPVRELGGIGTGDLPALALVGLALAGEVATDPPLPVRFAAGPGDALALVSSNAAALGDSALAVDALARAARAALVVAAITHVAAGGNAEAFDPAVELATPFPGARAVCVALRGLLGAGPAAEATAGAGAETTAEAGAGAGIEAAAGAPIAAAAGAAGGTSDPTASAHVQDRYALRALPQVHGALLDRLTDLDAVVTAMANAPSENPVFTPGTEPGVAHHGGFHAVYLAQALDAARSALAQAAQLGLARIGLLIEPGAGRAAFLGDGTPGASGVMALEYVAADALTRLRSAAVPFAVQSVSLSRGVEEDASFAAPAAAAALEQVDRYRTVTACELVCAVRALRQGRRRVPPGLAAALERCGVLPADDADRDLTGDVAQAEQLLGGLASPLV